ncbi:hypothetical protein ACIBCT_25180 [Streptosporangium sp. NPDC050855]|uniref:hypothetical protein n=1 Tax=Streptosporangium sp. NPDC050855 TaxID=3366194 RepID=UPI0037883A50
MKPLDVRPSTLRTASGGLGGVRDDLAAHGRDLGGSPAMFGTGPVGGLVGGVYAQTVGAILESLESVVTDLGDAEQALGLMDAGYRRAERLGEEAVSQAVRGDSPASRPPSSPPAGTSGTAGPG